MTNKRHWIGVLRLWSLTAATVPVAVGTALASRGGHFSWLMLTLTMSAGICLQLSANLLNTYGDFCSGVDTPAQPPNAPQLVFGNLRPAHVKASGLVALVCGAGAGIAAAALSDWRLLWFAAAGVLGAGCYTTGVRYKYLGMGVPAAALLMGILMVTASYFAQALSISLQSFIVSLPVACLVAAILHGEDLRDMASDRAAGIRTTALIVGPAAARSLFVTLHIAPYLIIGTAVITRILPALTLMTFLGLPLSVYLARACVSGETAMLEGKTAVAHLLFGVLLVAALLLSGTPN
ncbi:MAG: prenyltransferase [Kiritimatiellae bacterium]|nr:prenyltransferase [Kiritimatiellia bacterium]